MISALRSDLERYRRAEGSLPRALGNVALWGVACYRFGHWLYKEDPPAPAPAPRSRRPTWSGTSSSRPRPRCTSTRRPRSARGCTSATRAASTSTRRPGSARGCDIGHQVTIGTSAQGRRGAPVIGDGVYIGTGAKVIGEVKVGDGVKVAANSLVMTNVPAAPR